MKWIVAALASLGFLSLIFVLSLSILSPAAAEPTPTADITALPFYADPTPTATLLPCGYVSFFSTEGGSVTEPCECEYYQGKCYDGAVIDMLAEAEPGYAFTQWTCDSGWCACNYSGGINTTGIEDFYAADTALHFMVGCIFEITAHFSPVCTPTPTPTATATATATASASATPSATPTATCTPRT